MAFSFDLGLAISAERYGAISAGPEQFNIDTACVELKYSDSSMISINCTAVEDEVANSRFQRSELDWLIYNDPLSYAELILNGDPEEYLRTVTEAPQLDFD